MSYNVERGGMIPFQARRSFLVRRGQINVKNCLISNLWEGGRGYLKLPPRCDTHTRYTLMTSCHEWVTHDLHDSVQVKFHDPMNETNAQVWTRLDLDFQIQTSESVSGAEILRIIWMSNQQIRILASKGPKIWRTISENWSSCLSLNIGSWGYL